MKLIALIAACFSCLAGEAAARCYKAVNEMRFYYCEGGGVSLELDRTTVENGGEAFRRGQGVVAEIRLANETVPAALSTSWGAGRMESYPVVVEAPAEAVKVARAVIGDEHFDIILKSPAGAELVAFSGKFGGQFPKDALSQSQPVSSEPQQNAASAPQAETAGAAKEVAYSDPVGEACANDSVLSGLYDCACIADKAGPLRAEIADKRFAEQQKYVPMRRKALEAAQNQLAQATNGLQRAAAERVIERSQKSLAELEQRPDPSSIDTSALALQVYKGSSCKIGSYIQRTEMKNCLAAASNMSGVADKDAFCSCSAAKAASLWTESEESYKSTIATKIATEARRLCRG